MMHVIFFSGLRGAVAYACSNIFPNQYERRELILCTTTAIILITIFLQGPFIVPVVNLAKVKVGVDSTAGREGRDNIKLNMEETFIYPLVIKGWEAKSPFSIKSPFSPCNPLHRSNSNDWELSSGGGSLPGTPNM